MARHKRGVDLRYPAHVVWCRGWGLLPDRERQGRKAEVHPDLEVEIDYDSGKIYIHLFEWPGATFHLDKMPRTVTGAYLLADTGRMQLKVTKQGEGIDVALPARPLDPIATVLVLTTS